MGLEGAPPGNVAGGKVGSDGVEGRRGGNEGVGSVETGGIGTLGKPGYVMRRRFPPAEATFRS